MLGGCDVKGQPISRAEVFDFVSSKWSRIADLPQPRAAAGNNGCVVRENKIIIVGGVTTNQIPMDQVNCYNIMSNKWEPFPQLPIGVVGPYISLVDDMLYCIGGTDKKDCNQSVVFDFALNMWKPLPPKPHPCYSCGGYLYDRKLIIVGGRNGAHPVKEVEAFDLDTQQWEELSPMSSVRVFYSVVGLQDEIYVIGGLVPTVGITKIVEKYDIESDIWCRGKDLSENRSDSAYGVVGERIVIAGGLGGGENPGFMKSAECMSHRGPGFMKISSMYTPRASLTTISFEDKIAVVGGMAVGEGEKGPQSIVEILKVKDDASKSI